MKNMCANKTAWVTLFRKITARAIEGKTGFTIHTDFVVVPYSATSRGVPSNNRVQKRAAKFANHTNELGWETLAQRGMIARICALFTAYTGGTGLESDRGYATKAMLPG
jgi:hypothetical protein